MDRIREILGTALVKNVVLPGLIGALVGWLTRHNYSYLADGICAVSNGLAIYVEACVK